MGARSLPSGIGVYHLSFAYGSRKLFQNLNLFFSCGKVNVIFGENGVGKSSFLALLAGLLHPDSGEVCFFPQKKKDSLLFFNQETNFYSDLTLAENLRYALSFYDAQSSSMERLLEEFSLLGHGNHFVSQLSLGQKSRLKLAFSSLVKPRFFLLDEPETGLDQEGRKALKTLLFDLAQRGSCVILISHYPDFWQMGERYYFQSIPQSHYESHP